jgi:hypothetical protein
MTPNLTLSIIRAIVTQAENEHSKNLAKAIELQLSIVENELRLKEAGKASNYDAELSKLERLRNALINFSSD